MKKSKYILQIAPLTLVFSVTPVVLYSIGNYPRRNCLMESLSLLTILGFSMLVSQFYFTRINRNLVKKIKMVKVLKFHKIIGYLFMSILLLHPFFIIVPKFFDNGVSPAKAFVKIITTLSSLGIVLGLIAYLVMIVLLVTSFLRFKLHLKYTTWRNAHGYLTLIFVFAATCHIISIGRHSNTSFTIYYILIVASAVFYLLRTYLFKTSKR